VRSYWGEVPVFTWCVNSKNLETGKWNFVNRQSVTNLLHFNNYFKNILGKHFTSVSLKLADIVRCWDYIVWNNYKFHYRKVNRLKKWVGIYSCYITRYVYLPKWSENKVKKCSRADCKEDNFSILKFLNAVISCFKASTQTKNTYILFRQLLLTSYTLKNHIKCKSASYWNSCSMV